jgi:hypothetical protein
MVAFALTAVIQPVARGEDAPHLSAEIHYRDDFPTNSNKLLIMLDDVLTYYTVEHGTASARMLEPQRLPALVFCILIKQPTQEVKWLRLPLATFTSIDFQWLPMPRSAIGFKNMRIATKDGGAHVVDALVDGQEYRYVRTDKHGKVVQEFKGGLELRLDQSVSVGAGWNQPDGFYEWYAMRGIWTGKQRPHSPDNEWIINRQFIDRIEFVPHTEVKDTASKDADP